MTGVQTCALPISLEEIIKISATDKTKAGIFNNAAQVWNHTFYWHSMKPNGGGKPTGKILAKIETDFGSYDNFIKEFIMESNFPWYYNDYKVYEKDNDKYVDTLNNFQFTHLFYDAHKHNYSVNSPFFGTIIMPLLDIIKPLTILRVKANLTTITDKIIVSDWHTDLDGDKHKTAIYYVNTNNGKTFFKDGFEVDSVENRMVIFDGNMIHAGSSTTDTKTRCVINLNFI